MTKQKLILFYWLPIPFLIGFGLIFNGEIDINVHDTYFVVNNFTIVILVSIVLFVSGLGYFLDSAERANKILNKIQFWFYTIGGVGILVLEFIQFLLDKSSYSGEFIEYRNIEISLVILLSEFACLSILAAGFLVFVINMLGVISKKIKET